MHDWQAYLPAYVTAHLVARYDQSPVGYEQRFQAVVLFADIAGFTPLSEALAATGQAGAEELTLLINRCFDPLIRLVQQHGGIINSFGGDAMMALFPIADEPTLFVVQRALQCAFALQASVKILGNLTTAAGDWKLTLHIGLAVGEILHVTAGNPDERLLSIVTGEPLLNCGQAESHAEAGEVVVHVPSFAGMFLDMEKLADPTFARIRPIQQNIPLAPLVPLGRIDPTTLDVMAAYLHPSIAQRLRDKQTTFINERRNVTVLFVQFRNLDDVHDASLGKRLVSYFNAVLRIVQRYDGYINKVEVGDKGSTYLILFGAPVAHENDADRAAHCALELHALEHAEISIGMHTGFVFSGLIGSDIRQEYTVIGDVVNVAARLMQIADSGQILITQVTNTALSSAFITDPLPVVWVKGKNEPIERFELTDLRQTSVRFQEPNYVLPMVGRSDELAFVGQQLAQVKQRKGQIIAITGDAGMGKSRLGSEIRRIARAQRIAVYGGECLSYGTNISYLLWHNLWRAFFNVDPTWLPELQMLQLRAQLAVINPDLLDWMPLLANAMRLPISDSTLAKLLDVRSRKVLLESVLGNCVRYRANETPLLFVLEDCHWIDPLSLDLLNHIAKLIADVPIMLVLLYRPPADDQEAQWLEQIQQLPYFHRIQLQEFTADETAELVRLKLRYMLGSGVHLDDGWVTQIAERAQGNPFYIEELLNLMVDRGLDPTSQEQRQRMELPDSLHRLIISRIDQLDERAKTTLKVASVIGRLFKAQWLSGAYPELGSTDAVINRLDMLSRLDLTPLDRVEPEREYLFKHVITQEVAYQSLPYTTRAKLHEQIAEYIENSYGDASSVDLLAHHYGLSTNRDKQREYFRKAGDAAAARYANETAIDYYRRLLHLLQPAELVPILFEIGSLLKFAGRWNEAHEMYQEALTNATLLNDIDAMGRAMSEISDVDSSQGFHAEALTYSDRSLELAQQAQNVELQVRVLLRKGWVLYAYGQLNEALHVAEQAVERGKILNDHQLLGLSYKLHGYMLVHLGQPKRALASFERALELHQSHDDREDIGRIYNVMGEAARVSGDYAAAVEWYKQALAIGRELRNPERLIMYTSNLGGALVGLGKYAQAIKYLHQALGLTNALSWYAISETYRFLAEAYAGQGEHETAFSTILQSLKFARDTQQVLDHGNALRTLGTLWELVPDVMHQQDGLPTSARDSFAQAYLIHREANAAAEQARTLRAWGNYEQQYGDAEQATLYLRHAYTIFQELGLDHELATFVDKANNS